MQCGLLHDKYIHYFLNHHHHHRGNLKRFTKPPIINRGTFLRTISIDSLTREFIKLNSTTSGKSYQIISFGSGFDTRLFRFVEEFNKELGNLKYFEIDFDFVIEEKKRIIENTPELIELELDGHWCPIKFDLNIKSEDEISNLFKGFDFDVESPTLILAECCLMYLTPLSGDHLISWAAKTLKYVTFCSFDPVLSDDLESDRFAKTMLDNFQQRGLSIDALLAYPSKQSTLGRFSFSNNLNVKAFTMLQLEQDPETEFLVSKQQRREMAFKTALDEYEEWNLLAQHYLLVIAKSESSK